jgi:hypothetical protein
MFADNGFIKVISINSSTRRITSTTAGGGGVIYDVNSTNYMSTILNKPQDTISGQPDL